LVLCGQDRSGRGGPGPHTRQVAGHRRRALADDLGSRGGRPRHDGGPADGGRRARARPGAGGGGACCTLSARRRAPWSAPGVAARLAANSGAIAAWERRLVDDLARRAERERRQMAVPPVNSGAAVRGLLEGYPGGRAYVRRYGGQLEQLTDGLVAPLQGAVADQAAAITQRFAREAAAGESVCQCRARAAINNGHSALAVFTATGGLVSWPPVDDWPAAMAAPDVVAQCKEVS